jgi:hypothetical protein
MLTSVALGIHFEECVRQLLDSGRFNNASEGYPRGLAIVIPLPKRRSRNLKFLVCAHFGHMI